MFHVKHISGGGEVVSRRASESSSGVRTRPVVSSRAWCRQQRKPVWGTPHDRSASGHSPGGRASSTPIDSADIESPKRALGECGRDGRRPGGRVRDQDVDGLGLATRHRRARA